MFDYGKMTDVKYFNMYVYAHDMCELYAQIMLQELLFSVQSKELNAKRVSIS